MFDVCSPAHSDAPYVVGGESLAPLVPPVISEPLRRRAGTAQSQHTRSAPTPTPTQLRVASRAPIMLSAGAQAVRRGVRPAMRGYAAVLGLAVSAIAVCSALTVANADPAPSVRSVQVVARGGESVEGVAARSAQGRDIGAVAESIRLANGLTNGELLQAGEVLIVPGS